MISVDLMLHRFKAVDPDWQKRGGRQRTRSRECRVTVRTNSRSVRCYSRWCVLVIIVSAGVKQPIVTFVTCPAPGGAKQKTWLLHQRWCCWWSSLRLLVFQIEVGLDVQWIRSPGIWVLRLLPDVSPWFWYFPLGWLDGWLGGDWYGTDCHLMLKIRAVDDLAKALRMKGRRHQHIEAQWGGGAAEVEEHVQDWNPTRRN